MSSVSDDTQPAMTYPTNAQYARWKKRADELDMSVSEFMQGMIEAGMKKFDATVEPDETPYELREQRNDLKDELDHARARIDRLENRLHRSERAAVSQYVEQNPVIDALERHDLSVLEDVETPVLVNLYTLLSDVQCDANDLRKDVSSALLDRLHHDQPVHGQFGSIQRTTRCRRSLKNDEEVLATLENAGSTGC